MDYAVRTPSEVATFVERVMSDRTVNNGKIVITIESNKLNRICVEEED